jgi:flagellar secretion chaperone FliS
MKSYTAYSTVDNNVDDNNKPKLLLKVYQSMLDKIAIVKFAIEHNDFEKKYIELTKVITVLEILNSSLDTTYGEITNNLSGLYQYLIGRLASVHGSCEVETLEECKSILARINEGFVAAYQNEINEKRGSQQRPDSKLNSFNDFSV